MKKQHYTNIGIPKSGTSWLFECLENAEEIDYNKEKEPSLKNFNQEHEYIEYFKDFNFSLNFNVATWSVDQSQLNFIKKNSTHCSIILRNPYQVINSLFNFLSTNTDHRKDYVIAVKNHIRYADIIKRWHNHENFKIFYYNDLKNNSQEFLNTVSNYLNIKKLKNMKKVNVTNYVENIVFDKREVDIVNDEIKKLEDFLQQDFSEWYK